MFSEKTEFRLKSHHITDRTFERDASLHDRLVEADSLGDFRVGADEDSAEDPLHGRADGFVELDDVERPPDEVVTAGDSGGALDHLGSDGMALDLVQRDEVGSALEATTLDQLLADLLVVHDHVPNGVEDNG